MFLFFFILSIFMQTQDLLKQWLVDNNKFGNPPKEHVSGNFNLILTCKIIFENGLKKQIFS